MGREMRNLSDPIHIPKHMDRRPLPISKAYPNLIGELRRLGTSYWQHRAFFTRSAQKFNFFMISCICAKLAWRIITTQLHGRTSSPPMLSLKPSMGDQPRNSTRRNYFSVEVAPAWWMVQVVTATPHTDRRTGKENGTGKRNGLNFGVNNTDILHR